MSDGIGDLAHAVNVAAGELPEGWEITIEIERGCAMVKLWRYGGNWPGDGVLNADDFGSVDSSLAEQILEAIQYATAATP